MGVEQNILRIWVAVENLLKIGYQGSGPGDGFRSVKN